MKTIGKKVISLCLGLLTAASVLSACGQSTPGGNDPAAGTEGVKLWWAYNTENLMQDSE